VAERTAELEAMVEQLEAFSYTVSHDLRAPLRGIDGFSQVLLASHASELSEEAQGYLQRIRNSAQRMGTLIEHLLEFSRLSRSALERTCVDLSSLAREIVATLREQEPDREVTVEIAEDLRARGDERLLGVALENLLHNAWKFTRRAREARIEVGRAVTPEGEAFFVRDNGAGFDMRHYAMLFGVFRRLHSVSEFEGTGIGLATVQRIIERHGGRVWAEAAVGEGATFYFTLPEEAPRERHRQAG
jgi:light-regulated signal transduction histidine kinase (bacteriophytochrome)